MVANIVRWILAIEVFATCIVAIGAHAQSPSCDDAGGSGSCLPWGVVDLSAVLPGPIFDLSRDGGVVAGPTNSFDQVYQWKLGNNPTILNLDGVETLPLGRPVMTDNGAIVVGVSQQPGPAPRLVFRWDVDAGTHTILPAGPTEGIDDVYGLNNGTVLPTGRPSISSDGTTIVGVGEARIDTGALVDSFWPFYWTEAAGTSDLPQEAFGNERFSNLVVSGDGDTIVGEVVTNFGNLQADFWTGSSVHPAELGTLWVCPTALHRRFLEMETRRVGGELHSVQATLPSVGTGFLARSAFLRSTSILFFDPEPCRTTEAFSRALIFGRRFRLLATLCRGYTSTSATSANGYSRILAAASGSRDSHRRSQMELILSVS